MSLDLVKLDEAWYNPDHIIGLEPYPTMDGDEWVDGTRVWLTTGPIVVKVALSTLLARMGVGM